MDIRKRANQDFPNKAGRPPKPKGGKGARGRNEREEPRRSLPGKAERKGQTEKIDMRTGGKKRGREEERKSPRRQGIPGRVSPERGGRVEARTEYREWVL